jgi:hypothetical protein
MACWNSLKKILRATSTQTRCSYLVLKFGWRDIFYKIKKCGSQRKKWLLLATGLGIPYLLKNSSLNLKRKGNKGGSHMTISLKSIKIKLFFGCHITEMKFLVHVQNTKRNVHQNYFNLSHLTALCHLKKRSSKRILECCVLNQWQDYSK